MRIEQLTCAIGAELVDVNLGAGAHKTPEFLQLTRLGRCLSSRTDT